MAESQRVLSGSIVKGSKASLSGSAQYFTQGINANTFTSYLGSLIPRVGSGDRTQLYRNNKKISSTVFDDTTTLNNQLNDMGGENDDAFEERISFSYEKRNFGQHTEMPLGEPFADLIDFDPVTYLNDNDSFMWPVNLWNLGSLTDHEFDGIIEPLDIRPEILGELDTKYQGRAIRGAVVGSFSNRPWGSIEIKDSWKANESHGFAFLDAPTTMSSSAGFTATQVYETPNYLTASFTTSGGYTYTQATAEKLHLWLETDATPDDRSPDNASVTVLGTETTNYAITTESVGGDQTHKVWNYAGSASEIGYDLGLPGTYWDNKIGLGAASIPTTGSYVAPGATTFTVAMWIKLGNDATTTSSGPELFSFGQRISNASSGAAFEVGLSNGSTSIGDSRPSINGSTSNSKRLMVSIRGGNWTANQQEASDVHVTQDWNYFHDKEWHHLAVAVEVVQGNNSSAPPTSTTIVDVHIDGVKKNMLLTSYGTSFKAVYGGDSSYKLVDTAGSKAGKMRLFHNILGQEQYKGSATEPAIWGTKLTSDEVNAVYEVQKNKQIQETLIDHHNVPENEIKAISLQGYQNIESPSDNSFEEKDHHEEVFITLTAHNGNDMQNALRLLNSSSCDTIADPNVKRSSRGFYFGENAGSITFGDSFMIGELK